jgi:IS5 family transposase
MFRFAIKNKTNQEDLRMRKYRRAQESIYDYCGENETGRVLRGVTRILDDHPQILDILAKDLTNEESMNTGRRGLSVESVFRCLLLKQQFSLTYSELAFFLEESPTYRTFAQLEQDQFPSRSALHSLIRRIQPETLERVYEVLAFEWANDGTIDPQVTRIDSTVVKSNIAEPSDSQLLSDGIRVLSRLLSRSKIKTGVSIKYNDKRKEAKSLSYRIFHAKKAEKDLLYEELIHCAHVVLDQVNRALPRVQLDGYKHEHCGKWMNDIFHYRSLLQQIIDQTQRRVFNNESVPAAEKIVSLFEPHTDIIKKDSSGETYFGHKVNFGTDVGGYITYCSIENGNPADSTLYIDVINKHENLYGKVPKTTVADGGYASKENVTHAKEAGVSQRVFHKSLGIGFHDMGIKKKTMKKLKNFRAGIEGNISELKRRFGLSKSTWKGIDGFHAYIWSSVLCYNLVRQARPG